MSARLRLEKVSYGWGGRPLLTAIDLALAEGELLLITGASGSGKSTLLEICAGLLEPPEGHVRWRGQTVAQLEAAEIEEQRTHMGVMFQRHALISNYTIFENIALPLRYHLRLSDAQVHARVSAQLAAFELEGVARHLPEQVSLGQARLASFGRALIMQPDLLLLDEPTIGLDEAWGGKLLESVATLQRSAKLSAVIFCQTLPAGFSPAGMRHAVLDKGILAMGQ
jgi:phospholipid/cholesterol/gamma-HCH transport system ATP-binding protein